MTWKAILYLRKARIDQDEVESAFDEQEIMLKNYCAIHNIKVIGIYRDIYSGATFNRPAFNDLVNFLEFNKGVANLLLFTTWDRFARSCNLAISMTDKLIKLGVESRAIQETDLQQECLNNINYN